MFYDIGFDVPMVNTTPVSSDSSRSFTNLEKKLFCGIGVTFTLFILQSICFIVYIIRVKSKRRRKREISLTSNLREPLSNEENNSVRYSSRPLKQVSDPEIYESLKDIIPSSETAPPLPPIATLPKRKPGENVQSSDTLYRRNHAEDKELVDSIASRPRLPLPNEIGASQLSSKNNIFATMPRIPFPKPVPKPSSTLTRYPKSDSPHTNIRPERLPIKNELPPPKPHPSILSSSSHHVPIINPLELRTLPKPRSPAEIQNKSTLPSETNNEISVENELLQKLKKRAQLIPLSPQEISVQQVSNNTTRLQPQPIKHEPYIHNELMQKLKKRAALIPDTQNQRQKQQQLNSSHRVQTQKYKPLPPTPRQSDYEGGWEDNFDTIEPLEQIHMYNI